MTVSFLAPLTMRDYGKLLGRCEDVIKSFNPIVMTADSHQNNQLGTDDSNPEIVFIKQVFYGCVRYKAALKVDFCERFTFMNRFKY